MVTYNEYLKSILSQIYDSYLILSEVKDKPGDLDLLNKEMSKINGMAKVIITKIDPQNITNSNFKALKSKFTHYVENYSFEQEIQTMGPLYSNDVSRIKNMRLKILESLEDNRLIRDVEDLIEKI